MSKTLQHTATPCNTLQRTATTHYNTLQHTATHCNALQQHTATHCNHAGCRIVSRYDIMSYRDIPHGCRVLQLVVAVCCSGSQCVAVCCNGFGMMSYRAILFALQRSATHYNTLQHTTTHLHLSSGANNTFMGCKCGQLDCLHCNKLQHTATHCNTPQHTATHCNPLKYTSICLRGPTTLSWGASAGNQIVCTATNYNTLQHTKTHLHLSSGAKNTFMGCKCGQPNCLLLRPSGARFTTVQSPVFQCVAVSCSEL